jgi:hypothetical protein
LFINNNKTQKQLEKYLRAKQQQQQQQQKEKDRKDVNL